MPTNSQVEADLILRVGKAQAAMDSLGRRSVKFNLDSRSFAEPLGRITGQIGEFDKSFAAANARVISFGASAGIIYAVKKAFDSLITSAVLVEKRLAEININLNLTKSSLQGFGKQIFNIARETGQSFDVAAQAAAEFSRQGLGSAETIKRTKDALILSRLALIDTVTAQEDLTAAINSFGKSALNTSEIVAKFARVDANFAVSSKDLAEAIKRVGSVAEDTGISIDELNGLVTAAQQITSRGGAVIGNSLKTIFTRLESSSTIQKLRELGVEIDVTQTGLEKLQAIANRNKEISIIDKSAVKELAAGKLQINILTALLSDLGNEYGVVARATEDSKRATTEHIEKNKELNKTLDATIKSIGNSITQIGGNFGKASVNPILTIFDNLTKILAGANNDPEEKGRTFGEVFARGIAQGIGNILTGPGLLLAIGGLGALFSKFGRDISGALQTVLGINNVRNQTTLIEEKISQNLSKEDNLLLKISKGAINHLTIQKQITDQIQAQIIKSELVARAAAVTVAGFGQAGIALTKQGTFVRTKAEGFIPKTAGGFIPESDSIQEIIGAKRAGYEPGQVKDLVVPNLGRVIYNDREKVKYFDGFSQPAIMPPESSRAGIKYKERFKESHGFDPYKAEGNIPNFAEIQKLVAYHISKVTSPTFESKYKTDLSSMGFHFGTEEQAKFRSNQYDFISKSPTMGKYALSIKNPLEVSHMASFAPDHLADKMMDMGILKEEQYLKIRDRFFDESKVGNELVKILKKKGYDGLKYINEREGEGFSYVPFDKQQIERLLNKGLIPNFSDLSVLKSIIRQLQSKGINIERRGFGASYYPGLKQISIPRLNLDALKELGLKEKSLQFLREPVLSLLHESGHALFPFRSQTGNPVFDEQIASSYALRLLEKEGASKDLINKFTKLSKKAFKSYSKESSPFINLTELYGDFSSGLIPNYTSIFAGKKIGINRSFQTSFSHAIRDVMQRQRLSETDLGDIQRFFQNPVLQDERIIRSAPSRLGIPGEQEIEYIIPSQREKGLRGLRLKMAVNPDKLDQSRLITILPRHGISAEGLIPNFAPFINYNEFFQPNTKKAISFVSKKYPRLFNLAKSISFHPEESFGQFPAINDNDKIRIAIGRGTTDNEVVSSIVHELVHSYNAKRQTKQHKASVGEYRYFDNLIKKGQISEEQLDRYRTIPEEVLAAGSEFTAVNRYVTEKFKPYSKFISGGLVPNFGAKFDTQLLENLTRRKGIYGRKLSFRERNRKQLEISKLLSGQTGISQEELLGDKYFQDEFRRFVPNFTPRFIQSAKFKLSKVAKPSYEYLENKFGKDYWENPEFILFRKEQRQKEDNFESFLQGGILRGLTNYDELKGAGLYVQPHFKDFGSDIDRYGQVTDLPGRLFHVTTDISGVRQFGLKSRKELGFSEGPGLGGGPDDTISFTKDFKTGRGIQRSIIELSSLLKGNISVEDLVNRAKSGFKAKQPFLEKFVKYSRGSLGEKADLLVSSPRELDKLKTSKLADIHRAFSFAQEEAGGYLNPLFFSSDYNKIKGFSKKDVKLLEFSPKYQQDKGLQVSSLGEIRSFEGNRFNLNNIFSNGQIPNFASPLTQSIQREISSGISPSQVRVGKDSLIKSPQNPFGLGVFNTRDEPGGLRQGINRAIKEGRNPRTYNVPKNLNAGSISNTTNKRPSIAGGRVFLSEGRIPNYGDFEKIPNYAIETDFGTKEYLPRLPERERQALASRLNELNQALGTGAKDLTEVSKELEKIKGSSILTNRQFQNISLVFKNTAAEFQRNIPKIPAIFNIETLIPGGKEKLGQFGSFRSEIEVREEIQAENESRRAEFLARYNAGANIRQIPQFIPRTQESPEQLELFQKRASELQKNAINQANQDFANFGARQSQIAQKAIQDLKDKYGAEIEDLTKKAERTFTGPFAVRRINALVAKNPLLEGQVDRGELTRRQQIGQGRLQQAGFTASFAGPLLGGIVSEAIGDETRGRRGAGQVANTLGNMLGFAGLGVSLGGGPLAAIGGALLGLLVGLPGIIRGFTDIIPDLERNIQKLKEEISDSSDAYNRYIDALQRLEDSANLRPEVVERLKEQLAISVTRLRTPEEQEALAGAKTIEEARLVQGRFEAKRAAPIRSENISRDIINFLRDETNFISKPLTDLEKSILSQPTLPFGEQPPFLLREQIPTEKASKVLDSLISQILATRSPTTKESVAELFLRFQKTGKPFEEEFKGKDEALTKFLGEITSASDIPIVKETLENAATLTAGQFFIFFTKLMEALKQANLEKLVKVTTAPGPDPLQRIKQLSALDTSISNRFFNERVRNVRQDFGENIVLGLNEIATLEDKISRESAFKLREPFLTPQQAIQGQLDNQLEEIEDIRRDALIAAPIAFERSKRNLITGSVEQFVNIGRKDIIANIQDPERRTKAIKDFIKSTTKVASLLEDATPDLTGTFDVISKEISDLEKEISELEAKASEPALGDRKKTAEIQLEFARKTRESLLGLDENFQDTIFNIEKTATKGRKVAEGDADLAKGLATQVERLSLGGDLGTLFDPDRIEKLSQLNLLAEKGTGIGKEQAILQLAQILESSKLGLPPDVRTRLEDSQAKLLTRLGVPDAEKVAKDIIDFEFKPKTVEGKISGLKPTEQEKIDNQISLIKNTRTLIADQTKIVRLAAERLYIEGQISAEQLRQARNADNLSKIDLGDYGLKDTLQTFKDTFKYNSKDFYRDLEDGAIELGQTLKTSFSDAFKSFADGSKSASEALRGLGISFATKLLEKSFDATTNLAFGALGDIGSAIARSYRGQAEGGYVQKFGVGGKVMGGSGIKDDVFALLNEGEYVIKKPSVQKYGEGFLNRLNSGGLSYRKYQSGGEANIKLANEYLYDDNSRPTRGENRIDPRLSNFALSNEDDLATQRRMQREQELYDYLRDKSEYERQKQNALDQFKRAKKQRLIAAYTSAAIGIASAGISAGISKYQTSSSLSRIEAGTATAKDYSRASQYFASQGNYTQAQNYAQQANLARQTTYEGYIGAYYGQGSFYQLPKNFRADGGMIKKYNFGGSTDKVPALLTGGEYVVNRDSVSKLGVDFMDRVNQGKVSKFAFGGYVGSPSPITQGLSDGSQKTLDVLIKMQDGQQKIIDLLSNKTPTINNKANLVEKSNEDNSSVFNLTFSTNVTIDSKGQTKTDNQQTGGSETGKDSDKERAKKLGDSINGIVYSIMTKELRPNGLLREAIKNG